MCAHAQAGAGNKCKNRVYFIRGHQVAFELYRMYLPFLFSVQLKGENSQKQVLMKLCLLHTKAAACTCDIIGNAPAINTINRHDVFAFTITLCITYITL